MQFVNLKCVIRSIKMFKSLKPCLFELRRSISSAIFSNQNTGTYIPRNYVPRKFSNGNFPLDNIQNLTKDVVLYTYEKSGIFKFIGAFGTVQFFVWLFLGHTLFTNLIDIKPIDNETEEEIAKKPMWRRVNLGDLSFRYGAVIACVLVGVSSSFLMFFMPLRIVKELVLCKGGRIARVITYAPFGKTREMLQPLHHITCTMTRMEASSYVAMRIKGKSLFYLIDCKGQFHNPQMFDLTIGAASSHRR